MLHTLTEKGKNVAGTKTKEKMEIFGGYYEKKSNKTVKVVSPYDEIIESIYGEE